VERRGRDEVSGPTHDRGRFRRAALGVVALALFAAAVGATWVFLTGGFRGGTAVTAVFSSPGVGQQLPVGGDVKVKGVLVGTIGDIRLDRDGNAVVELRLEEDLDLPADTTAEIRSKTVFGQKWVELIPPEDSGADTSLLEAGTIPDDQTVEPLELERALQLGHDLISEIPLDDLAVVLEALADGFSGGQRGARRAIERGLVALRAVNSRSAELDLGLRQLAEFSAWLDDNDDTLLGFMSSADSANRALTSSAPEFVSNLQSVPDFLNQFAAFQVRVEDDLGALIEDGARVAEMVAKRSGALKDLVLGLEAFTTVWNSGLSQPCKGLYEQNLTCWQVYLMPGLESRGLYRAGGSPDSDEPGDPNFRQAVMTESELRALLGSDDQTPEEIARLMFGDAVEYAP
jgi:phospholipid/cholesterol/gamma-HCH transport system substrate-binding protein